MLQARAFVRPTVASIAVHHPVLKGWTRKTDAVPSKTFSTSVFSGALMSAPSILTSSSITRTLSSSRECNTVPQFHSFRGQVAYFARAARRESQPAEHDEKDVEEDETESAPASTGAENSTEAAFTFDDLAVDIPGAASENEGSAAKESKDGDVAQQEQGDVDISHFVDYSFEADANNDEHDADAAEFNKMEQAVQAKLLEESLVEVEPSMEDLDTLFSPTKTGKQKKKKGEQGEERDDGEADASSPTSAAAPVREKKSVRTWLEIQAHLELQRLQHGTTVQNVDSRLRKFVRGNKITQYTGAAGLVKIVDPFQGFLVTGVQSLTNAMRTASKFNDDIFFLPAQLEKPLPADAAVVIDDHIPVVFMMPERKMQAYLLKPPVRAGSTEVKAMAMKEVHFQVNIREGDMWRKVMQAASFLLQGHPVRVHQKNKGVEEVERLKNVEARGNIDPTTLAKQQELLKQRLEVETAAGSKTMAEVRALFMRAAGYLAMDRLAKEDRETAEIAKDQRERPNRKLTAEEKSARKADRKAREQSLDADADMKLMKDMYERDVKVPSAIMVTLLKKNPLFKAVDLVSEAKDSFVLVSNIVVSKRLTEAETAKEAERARRKSEHEQKLMMMSMRRNRHKKFNDDDDYDDER